MQRCGFRAQGLFVMDGSKRSAHANAYFTGFGSSQARGVLRHPAAAAVAGRDRGRAGARARPLQPPPRAEAAGADVAHQPGQLGAAGLAVRTVWFYTGLGVQPNLMRAQRRAGAAAVHRWSRRCSSFFARTAAEPAVAPARVRGRCLRLSPRPTAGDLASALLKLYQDNASTLTPDPLYVRFHYYSTPPPPSASPRLPGADPPPPCTQMHRTRHRPASSPATAATTSSRPPRAASVQCSTRGKKSECVVGDRVRWQVTDSRGHEGVIEAVEPGATCFYRQDEWKTKSFAANLDRLLVLVAAEPVFSESQLTRALIAAAHAGIRGAHPAQQDRPDARRPRPRATPRPTARWVTRSSRWR